MKAFLIAPGTDDWKQITGWLQQLGWMVEHVQSCRTAFKLIESDPDIDLVLIDGASGESCGLPLVRNLRGDHRLESIPIVAGSAEITSDIVSEYLTLGVEHIILLPTTAETLRSKIHQATSAGRISVLVVDDQPAIRELLSDFLTIQRYQPILASCVDEALEVLGKSRVDVVVTDILMPGKTGLDLLVHVKHVSPDIPVILVTGHSGRFTPEKIITMGADGYFQKPFHNMELVQTLRKVLRSRRRPGTVPGSAVLSGPTP
jgi:DNA-binding NtrC family response regulator